MTTIFADAWRMSDHVLLTGFLFLLTGVLILARMAMIGLCLMLMRDCWRRCRATWGAKQWHSSRKNPTRTSGLDRPTATKPLD